MRVQAHAHHLGVRPPALHRAAPAGLIASPTRCCSVDTEAAAAALLKPAAGGATTKAAVAFVSVAESDITGSDLPCNGKTFCEVSIRQPWRRALALAASDEDECTRLAVKQLCLPLQRVERAPLYISLLLIAPILTPTHGCRCPCLDPLPQVCKPLAAVQAECAANKECKAFTWSPAKACGYLKRAGTSTTKRTGWTVYRLP